MAVSGIIILLIWLYLTSFIIIGAEINAIIHQRLSLMDKLLKKRLDHDDNNQNHYNEDTTYEYKHTATGKDEDYKVDKDPEDKHEDASLTEEN